MLSWISHFEEFCEQIDDQFINARNKMLQNLNELEDNILKACSIYSYKVEEINIGHVYNKDDELIPIMNGWAQRYR